MRKQDKDRNGKPEALLWLDFETTGTDRNDSLPLEVGMECTDVLGEHSFGSLHRIIRPDYLDLLDMGPVAFSMHTDNGLLFELLNGSAGNDCVEAVANAVEEYLESLSQRFTLVPAGTNVVRHRLPETSRPEPGQVAVLPQVRPDHAPPVFEVHRLSRGSVRGASWHAQGARLHPTRHQRLHPIPHTPEGSMVMTAVSMMLLCAAVLVAWIGGRP